MCCGHPFGRDLHALHYALAGKFGDGQDMFSVLDRRCVVVAAVFQLLGGEELWKKFVLQVRSGLANFSVGTDQGR